MRGLEFLVVIWRFSTQPLVSCLCLWLFNLFSMDNHLNNSISLVKGFRFKLHNILRDELMNERKLSPIIQSKIRKVICFQWTKNNFINNKSSMFRRVDCNRLQNMNYWMGEKVYTHPMDKVVQSKVLFGDYNVFTHLILFCSALQHIDGPSTTDYMDRRPAFFNPIHIFTSGANVCLVEWIFLYCCNTWMFDFGVKNIFIWSRVKSWMYEWSPRVLFFMIILSEP